jgi:membrane protein
MQIEGFLLGLGAFCMVGLCHPLVIKIEYYIGKRVWWIIVLIGLCALVLSLLFSGWWSLFYGILGACLLWTALELIWQHERVAKGRAKRNPKRSDAYYQLSKR